MRNLLLASGCKPVLKLSVVALLSGGAAACSSDVARFSNPSANPFSAQAGSPAYTGSVASAPTGQVQSGPIGGAGAGGSPSYGTPSYGAPSYGAPSAPAPAYPSTYGAASTPSYPAPLNQAQAGGAPRQLASASPAQQPLYGTQPQSSYGSPAYPAPLQQPAPAAVAAAPAATGGGSHVVTSGETLSSISRTYGVSRAALAQANGLDMNAQVRIGQNLTIPAAGNSVVASAPRPASSAPAPVAAAPAQPTAAPAAVASAPVNPAPSSSPKATAASPAPAAEKPQTIAAVKPSETPDEARTGSGVQFRWPVRGRVISGFGPKPGGQQNEGINVSVPEGTSIKAAEDGVVAYAGSELKGYGNLVLIKHSDGYVTAYAHNSSVEVKKGDTVRRGQVIAKSGQTGNVSTPQLHFEIRKGSQPVDPSQYLAGL